MLQKPQFIYKLAKPPTLHGSVERLYCVKSLVPGLTRTRNTVDKLVFAVTTACSADHHWARGQRPSCHSGGQGVSYSDQTLEKVISKPQKCISYGSGREVQNPNSGRPSF